MSTQHPARSTPHAARSTPHAARSTPHVARSTPHVARSTPHAAPSTQHPARSTPIAFSTHKYGRELLVDAGWIHQYQTSFVLSDVPHRLAFFEVLLVTAGEGRLWLRGAPHAVRPGRVFLTAPGEERRWQAHGVDGRCLFFTPELLTGFFADRGFLSRLRGFQSPSGAPLARLTGPDEARWFEARLDDVEHEIASLRDDSDHLLRARVYELLVWLDRRVPRNAGAPQATGVPHVDRFVRLVDSQVPVRRRLSWYASALGITPGHLNDLCRRHLATSAGRIIRRRLAGEARRRLRYDDASAARIASDLGFEDPAYFTRFFTRETGMTPSAYRTSARRPIRQKDN